MRVTPVAGSARPVLGVSIPAAILGIALLAIGLFLAPERALHAYLAAYAYGLSIALGALCLVMIAHASGAKWFVVVRRLAEAVAGTLPVFALLLVPVLLGSAWLYPWVPPLDDLPETVREAVQAKDGWLNLPFFVARAVVYLTVWCGLAFALARWSHRQDRRDGADAPPRERPVLLSGLGLLAFAFTLTFAAVDWLMSLQPEWTSTVFGVYWFAGGMVGALALLTLLAWGLERGGPLAGWVAPSHYHALGRLLLTFVVFWAYIAYAQGFLIWIANLPAEAGWYLARWEHGWSWVLWTLILGHFALPFFALLSRPLKRSGRAMAAVAVWLLAMHYVDVFWLVLPALGHQRIVSWLWLDLAALAAVAGPAVGFAAWRLSGRPAVPPRDPRLAASVEYESP